MTKFFLNSRASLPVRTARLLQRSRTQTPSEAGVSDGSASPAPAPATLLQDVVDIKTLLLQLKRVLQEVCCMVFYSLARTQSNFLSIFLSRFHYSAIKWRNGTYDYNMYLGTYCSLYVSNIQWTNKHSFFN